MSGGMCHGLNTIMKRVEEIITGIVPLVLMEWKKVANQDLLVSLKYFTDTEIWRLAFSGWKNQAIQ